jgi:hypothetical protein
MSEFIQRRLLDKSVKCRVTTAEAVDEYHQEVIGFVIHPIPIVKKAIIRFESTFHVDNYKGKFYTLTGFRKEQRSKIRGALKGFRDGNYTGYYTPRGLLDLRGMEIEYVKGVFENFKGFNMTYLISSAEPREKLIQPKWRP